MSLIKSIRKWIFDTGQVMRQELNMMVRDQGVMLFFVALPLLYPVVYTLIYNPEVVSKVPVCIVDDSRTSESRELARRASAAKAFGLYGYAANMADARRLWAEQKVYAVMHIPADYAKGFNTGEQSHATMYCDMSLLLRYRALLSTMTSLQLKLARDITEQRVQSAGADASLGRQPVNSEAGFLGDTSQGFASFVMPGIVVLILQQSLILGAGLLGATSRERRRANGGFDPLEVQGVSTLATVWGKTLAYALFYIPAVIYVLYFIPALFDLPRLGNPVDYLLLIFPMLLASAFLGQCMVAALPEREYVFPVIVFSSVIFLFLSGLTWPRYAFGAGWYVVSNLVPSTWGVEGFVRINSNGATIAENAVPYIALWIQVALYSVLAALTHMWLKNTKRATQNENIC